MKISFEFTPDERNEIEDFVRGPEYKNALREMDEYLRKKIKYGEMSELEYDVYCEARNMLNQLTEGLNLHE